MRNISANTFADEFFGTLKPIHRLLWLGLLLNQADDQGRMLDNVTLMRSLLFPYDALITVKDIEKGLALFENHHKIIRYAVGTNGSSKHLIQIVNWWKYQKSAQWATRSLYPAPEKWTDRIRVHEKGNVLTTENWETAGGYIEATKRLRSRKVEATKGLGGSEDNNEVNNEVKDVVVVVADAYSLYEDRIGKPSTHEKKEIEKLFKINREILAKAIVITADHDKHTFAYLRGTFNNLRKGTQKPEPPTRGAKPTPKKFDSGKQVRL
jgi:hypothetical protein